MLRRLIPVHHDLFPDDIAFALDLRLGKNAVDVDVREDLAKPAEMGSARLRIVARVILCGERVDVPTDPFHILGDLSRVSIACALEKEVFDEMGNTALLDGLVPSAHSRPEPDGHCFHARHRGGRNANAIR